MKTINDIVKEEEEAKQNWKNSLNKFIDDFGVSCSEMRYLPYSSDGNILVSRKSYEKEMAYRRGEIKQGRAYQLPSWESLKIYSEN